jgi:cytochrome c-type biogenesis protein CcmH/NrfF
VHVNPLVNWVWFGFGMLAIGTGIALLPETAYSFALAKVPAGAVTTSLLLLLALVASPASLLAKSDDVVTAEQRSGLERRLENEVLCTCGCRRPLGQCGMINCEGHASQTAKLKAYLAEGKDHDAVLASFVKDFGSAAILAEPPDEGFNRLAWLFPYLVAGGSLTAIVIAARRWSRRTASNTSPEPALDPMLDARLDDELRNLD